VSNRDIGFVQPGQDTDHHRHLQFHPLRPPARPVAHALAGRGHARFAISFRTFQVCPKDLPRSGSQTEPAGGRRRAVRGEYFSVVCQFEFFEGGANHSRRHAKANVAASTPQVPQSYEGSNHLTTNPAIMALASNPKAHASIVLAIALLRAVADLLYCHHAQRTPSPEAPRCRNRQGREGDADRNSRKN
jgi:hypothetical protein